MTVREHDGILAGIKQLQTTLEFIGLLVAMTFFAAIAVLCLCLEHFQ